MIRGIPPWILKGNKAIFAPLLTAIVNNSISQSEFPDDVKLGATDRRNYRPITVLCALSKYLSVFYTLR